MISACVIVYFASQQKPLVLADSNEDQEFRVAHALGFLVTGSLGLMGLFYFHEYLVPVMTVGISFIALSACQLILAEIIVAFFGPRTLEKIVTLPYFGVLTGADILAFFGASMIVLTYLATKSWIFNNIIGVMLIFTMMKIVRMTNYKVAALLLGLAFFYDIFWVFYSDRFFGQSVMASVATRVDLPMKLTCPIMKNYPVPRCSLLGLGDMVLPGFFVAFCYNFDNLIKTRVYFKTCFIGYCTGLIICMFCLVVYDSAQPALLYLSPCTLIPVLALAANRGETQALWEGKVGGKSLSLDKKDASNGKKATGDEEMFERIEYEQVPRRDMEAN
jgi:signal peptide peptidase-like 2B